MNFTEETKINILENLEDNRSSDFAFIWGVTKCLASLDVYKQGFSLTYEIKNENLTNTLLMLLKKYYDFEIEFNFPSQEPRIYKISAKGKQVNDMLKSMGLCHYDNDNFVYDSGAKSLEKLTNRLAVQSFMQGVFCSVGGVYIPSDIDSREGYHLEMSFFQEDFAVGLQTLLANCDISLHYAERGNSYILYSKNSQTISDFFAFIKAMDSVTFINDIMIKRQLNNQINRASNSMVFNADKVAVANYKYINAINKIDNTIGIARLEEKLRDIAKARLENNTESMGELALRLNISKSSLSRALTKIVKISEEQ